MWWWRPAQIGPPQYTYERVVVALRERWSEPVDLPLLLSQTKYNWSLAAVDVIEDSATHDMVTQCVAGCQP